MAMDTTLVCPTSCDGKAQPGALQAPGSAAQQAACRNGRMCILSWSPCSGASLSCWALRLAAAWKLMQSSSSDAWRLRRHVVRPSTWEGLRCRPASTVDRDAGSGCPARSRFSLLELRWSWQMEVLCRLGKRNPGVVSSATTPRPPPGPDHPALRK